MGHLRTRSLALVLAGAFVACGSHDDPSGTGGRGHGEAATTGVGGGGAGSGGAAAQPADWALDLSGPVGEAVPTAVGAIHDVTEHGLDGTVTGALRYVAAHPFGTVGIAFDGSGSITVANPAVEGLADLAADASFTIELGFRTDVHGRESDDGSAVLLAREGGFALAIVDGRLRFSVQAKGAEAGGVTLDEPRVSDGLWHRAVATRDAASGKLRLTIDGVHTAEAADPAAGGAIEGDGTLTVGSREGGSAALSGEIDHVAFRRSAAAPVALEDAPGRVVVFAGGVDPVPGGGAYTNIRLPAIVRTTDGTLVAFAEGRVDASCDFGNIDIVEKRSTDHGLTWSSIERIVDHGTGKAGNPVPIYDEVHDRIVLLTTTTDTGSGTCPDPVAGSAKVQVRHSDDHGVTWSDPVDVTDELLDPAWNGVGLLGPAHGIQLRHGPKAGALVLHGMHRRDSDNRRGGHVYASMDGGETWTIAASENESAPEVEVNEGTLAELADGRLWVNVRHQADPESQWEAGLRGEAYLTPDLAYETTPAFHRIAKFRGPVVHGSTFRWPGSGRYGDEPRVFFSYPAGQYGTNFAQRHDLRLYASADETQTFAPGFRVYGGKTSYSDVVALDDAHLGVLFETADDDEDYNTRIDLQGLGVQSLDDATVLGWTFEDGAPGDAITSTRFPGPVMLTAEGSVTRVEGRHHSTAVHFEGSRLCASVSGLAHRADVGIRDGFEVEVSFRTTAHANGGSAAAGTLVAKSAVGTASAWWLRVEDGRVRFAVGDEAGHLDIVQSASGLSDGAFHTVVARRAPSSSALTLAVDGGAPVTQPTTTSGYVVNEERLCLGAFAGASTPRAFKGDIDAVAMRLTE